MVKCSIKRSEKERGSSLIEYALLVALIAIAALAAVQFFGQKTKEKYENIRYEISAQSIGPVPHNNW